MKDLKIDDYHQYTDRLLRITFTYGRVLEGPLYGGGVKNLADDEPYDYILIRLGKGALEYIPLHEIADVEVLD